MPEVGVLGLDLVAGCYMKPVMGSRVSALTCHLMGQEAQWSGPVTGEGGDRHFLRPCHWGEKMPYEPRQGLVRTFSGSVDLRETMRGMWKSIRMCKQSCHQTAQLNVTSGGGG